jgi:hypothetical protein
MMQEELPVHPFTGLRAVGIVGGRPVWPIMGGAPDDDDDDLGLDVTNSADDTTDEDGGAGTEQDDTADDAGTWSPPDRTEWDKVQKSLADANKQAALHRKEAQELKRAATKAARARTTAEQQKDLDDTAATAAQEAAEAAERKFKPIAVRAAARAKLLEAGLNAEDKPAMARLLRLIDIDEIELDDDGDPVGLDEQIDDLKTDMPRLFERQLPEPVKPVKARPARIDGANRSNDAPKPQTTGERHAARILGGAR